MAGCTMIRRTDRQSDKDQTCRQEDAVATVDFLPIRCNKENDIIPVWVTGRQRETESSGLCGRVHEGVGGNKRKRTYQRGFMATRLEVLCSFSMLQPKQQDFVSAFLLKKDFSAASEICKKSYIYNNNSLKFKHHLTTMAQEFKNSFKMIK